MSSLNITNLKNNNLIYYIYQVDLSIFGLKDETKYLIVADKEFVNNNDLDSKEFPWIYTVEEWFNLVEKGDMLPWICACMNKKFIHKEHVKLMMTTNPIQLRKNIDEEIMDAFLNWDTRTKESLFVIIAEIIFANQIIENHKIVNFNSPKKYFSEIKDNISKDDFLKLISAEQNILNKSTDGLLYKEKMDRIMKKVLEAEKLAQETKASELLNDIVEQKEENNEDV